MKSQTPSLFGNPDQYGGFSKPPQPPRFNGADYDPGRDDERLAGQMDRIFRLMRDGVWRTLAEIETATGDPPASISAQLRHLRKARFGGHQVDRNHLGNGLYQYRVIVNTEGNQAKC